MSRVDPSVRAAILDEAAARVELHTGPDAPEEPLTIEDVPSYLRLMAAEGFLPEVPA